MGRMKIQINKWYYIKHPLFEGEAKCLEHIDAHKYTFQSPLDEEAIMEGQGLLIVKPCEIIKECEALPNYRTLLEYYRKNEKLNSIKVGNVYYKTSSIRWIRRVVCIDKHNGLILWDNLANTRQAEIHWQKIDSFLKSIKDAKNL